MDSFELNKIIGAVLGTLLFVMGIGFLAEALYSPLENGPGYNLPEPEPVAVADAGPAEPEVPLGVLLASANAESGAADVRKCQSCHTFEEGGPNKQGPNLYGVVGRVIGSHEGFAYSEPFVALRDEGRTWTYDELDPFIAAPKVHIPGTKMTFAGVRTAEERADILAYLQTLAPEPVPFPAAEAAPEAAGATGEDLVEPTENSQPVDVVETPEETMGETSSSGTPTGSGTGIEPEQAETVPPAAGSGATAPASGDSTPAVEAPANPTAPANSTPVNTTEAPAPANTTETPAPTNTIAPANTTEAPANTTEAPANTAAPANTTEAPANAVAPANTTVAPANTTAPANAVAPANTTAP